MRILRHFSFIPRVAIITSAALLCLPTGNGSAGNYRDSAHGGSNDIPTTGQGAKRSSIPNAAGNCANCHEEHASLGGAGPANRLLFDTLAGNAVCNTCHNGSIAPPVDNISSQIAKTYSHDPNWGTGAALCHDCHDSHVAQHTNHSEATGGNLVAAGSPLLAVKGTTATNWIAGNPGAGAENLGSFTATSGVTITREYELCFKCHAGQLSPGAPNLDVSLQFNRLNFAVHPVATELNATWNNAFLKGPGFPTAWNGNWAGNLNAEMYCSDCHGSETSADPQGPHGSTIKYMLKLAGPGTSFDNLCLKCHMNPALPGNSSWVDTWGTALVGDHSLPAHQYSLANNPDGCLACHGDNGDPGKASSVHGANYVGMYNNIVTDTGRPSKAFLVSRLITKNYYTTANGDNPGFRFCASTCHVFDGGIGYRY